MRGLDNKTVIVTGGGGGIGRVTCRRFAEEGARVAVLDIDGESAEAVAAEIGGDGAMSVAVDLTDHRAVADAVAAVEGKIGPVGVLINNAGWDRFTPFLKSDPEYWSKIIDINLKSALNILHAVLPGMVDRHAGRVVTVSSDAGRVGSSGESVYSACKAGLIALSKTLAREHSRDNLTFNVVCPGLTDTAMFQSFMEGAGDPERLREVYRKAIPMGRIGEPEDLPGVISFLASDDAAFITGQVISVSGGLTMHG